MEIILTILVLYIVCIHLPFGFIFAVYEYASRGMLEELTLRKFLYILFIEPFTIIYNYIIHKWKN